MKTPLLFIALHLVSVSATVAQYCGTSPVQCTVTGAVPTGYHFTPSENIPCIVRGQNTNITIQFKAWKPNGLMSYQDLRIDTLSGLPAGLCWATNLVANELRDTPHVACLVISGITFANSGQYRLKMWITSDWGLSLSSPDNAESKGVVICLRVIDPAFSSCPPVDTSNHAPVYEYMGPRSDAAEIAGTMFFDVNANQVRDSLEQPAANQLLLINGKPALTNNEGRYHAYVQPGHYVITPVLRENLAPFPYNPLSRTVDPTMLATTYGGNDFAIIIPVNYCEGDLAIIGTNPPPRPARDNNVVVRVTNRVSSLPLSLTMSFTYDANQTFVSAVPAPTTADLANRILTWNFTGILSGTFKDAVVTLHSGNILLNSPLNHSAWISNASCPAIDSLPVTEQIIMVSSSDPNDKTVSPVGEQPGGRILPTTKLNYTIRFQNTGTYMAEEVIVVDTISQFLDISTIKVEAVSHPYEVDISGRRLTFTFHQINLPDSFSNEPLSHGFIKYSIIPDVNFVQGSVIHNRADIYFDFNEAVLTNTTVNTADNFTEITEVGRADALFNIYPNPLSTGNWQLKANAEMIGKEVKIFDAAGRIVFSLRITSPQSEIDASRFQQGVYIVKTEGAVVKVIKL